MEAPVVAVPQKGDVLATASTASEPRPTRMRRPFSLSLVLMAAPVVALGWAGWHMRWMADDAFIHLRVVSQLLAGHGPVFNAGERIEASTSALWVGILAFLSAVLPWVAREWLAVVAGLALSLWGLVAAQWGAVTLWGWQRGRQLAVPAGALVIVALPPFWDFSTSGLETGLEFAWLGTVFWGLSSWIRNPAERPRVPLWLPVAAGCGFLIRPDLALFSLAFLAVMARGELRRPSGLVRVLVAGAALPVAYQIFRMGYYASLVPNTALAKEAARSDWRQGFRYLGDFVRPYQLWIPVAVALALCTLLLLRQRQGGDADGFLLVVVLVVASLAYTLYIVRLGGDFMHARFLLPALFSLLLPVAALPVTKLQLGAVAALALWGLVCALALRVPYQHIGPKGIADERRVYVFATTRSNPVTVGDFGADPLTGWAQRLEAIGRDHGRLFAYVPPDRPPSFFSVRAGAPADTVAASPNIGVLGYAAGPDVYVADLKGLADAVGARLDLVRRGRPGHEKSLPLVWVLARFADPKMLPAELRVTSDEVLAARSALNCGELKSIMYSLSAPLTPHRFGVNLLRSFRFTAFRVDPNPVKAKADLCH